jgi:uncharacterized RDD family membrane protein YckC
MRSKEGEMIDTAYPKAPFDRRLLATLLDAAIACAPLGVAGALAAAVGWAGSPGIAILVGIVAGAPAFLWAAYYGFAKDGQERGQSIGKRRLGLMVVHLETNAPCNRAQSALRQLVMAGTNVIPYIGWLVEPVAAMAADGGRRLGDHAAGTQVIAVESYRAG